MNNKKNTRMCIICRNRKDKKDLIKIVQDENLGVKIDHLQKENKRGIYVCNEKECIEKLIKAKNINNKLKTSLSPSNIEEFINEIQELKKGVN